MEITAFVGPSGTGKSHNAVMVAHRRDIHYLIDDGLLVKDGRILAGRSAKQELNKVSAIRRALFHYNAHKEKVLAAIKKENPKHIMIVATSMDMAIDIAQELGLPKPTAIIKIEDVSSDDDIVTARYHRSKEGKHVIPVPHIEVRKSFAGQLVGKLKLFSLGHDRYSGEKTIVRPPFSFYGELVISPNVIEQLVERISVRTKGVSSLISQKVTIKNSGVSVRIEAEFFLQGNLTEIGMKLRERIINGVAYFTGLEVMNVWVRVVKIVIPTMRNK